MDDITPSLLEAIRRDFLENLEGNKRASVILQKIRNGKATYEDAGIYAEDIGAALADAFAANLSSETLPDGKMYWNIADRVVRPMLEQDHQLAADAAAEVQQHLNEAAGIGLKAQTAPVNEERVEGILNKLCAAGQFDDVAWMLNEPVKTFSREAVDETLRRNVEFQGKAGMAPKIIRRTVGHCCEWCSRLAGVYHYLEAPKDVYRRHDYCRCVVEYDPGDGKIETVHSGQEGKRRYETNEYGSSVLTQEARLQHIENMEATAEARAKAAREKKKATWQKKFEVEHLAKSTEELLTNYEKAIIPSSKLSGYILDMNHPKGRAKAIAFRDVLGYTADNEDELIVALQQGLGLWKATAREPTKYGQPFEVRMLITGPNGNRATVKTGWQIDKGEDAPRLVSAYIYND